MIADHRMLRRDLIQIHARQVAVLCNDILVIPRADYGLPLRSSFRLFPQDIQNILNPLHRPVGRAIHIAVDQSPRADLDEMAVGVIKARKHRAPRQIHSLGVRPCQLLYIRPASAGQYHTVLDRDRLKRCIAAGQRQNGSAAINDVCMLLCHISTPYLHLISRNYRNL